VIRNVKEGSIIVFHDSDKASDNLYYALPRTLDFLMEEGYAMRALPSSGLPRPEHVGSAYAESPGPGLHRGSS
jgi:hypothetical protein